MRTIRRATVVVLAVSAMGFALVVAEPAFAAAKDAVQSVFITNTADNPVPVNGTVTVANPTPAAAAPVLVQKQFGQQPITKANPFAGGVLYQVPPGKLLTVEFFQAHWFFSGVGLRQGSLRVGCTESTSPNVDGVQVFLEDKDAGLGFHVVGGALKMIVPGGTCLTYDIGADYADFTSDSEVIYMYGGFTGYLTDAPSS
jgi:hypothetical protein